MTVLALLQEAMKNENLHFLMAHALEAEADIVVTQEDKEANHVRQTAAAACKLGLKCYSLLERRVPATSYDYNKTGIVFFDQMFNGKIESRPPGPKLNAEAVALKTRLRADGRNPYFIRDGGFNEIGALGYVTLAEKLLRH